jgi:hypothetical protein
MHKLCQWYERLADAREEFRKSCLQSILRRCQQWGRKAENVRQALLKLRPP